MNQEFEAIVMGNYAELCIMWRIAHVQNPGEAGAYDAKLKSLEAVIDAFGLAMPDLTSAEEVPENPSTDGASGSEGKSSSELPASRLPDPATSIPSGPPSGSEGGAFPGGSNDGVILDDGDRRRVGRSALPATA